LRISLPPPHTGAMSAPDVCLFDVSRSVTGRAWRPRAACAREAETIAQRHGLPDLLSRLLASRSVGLDAVESYLNPTLRDLLPDPSVLADMDAAVERIVAAIRAGEGIGIIGDYDVDGMASTALLVTFLQAAGARPVAHLPDRMTEGYGPSIEAVTSLANRGVRLLVTLDCGTAADSALSAARSLGLDCIVVDHHLPGAALPPALAVVNPNRLDDASGLGHLAAAGLAFLLVVALNRALKRAGHWTAGAPDLLAELDLVALATVCDVVPLAGLNRAFVSQGLKVLGKRERVGLAALADAARLKRRPDAHSLGFVLGPRLNAAGRLGDAGLGLKLLLSTDRGEASAMAEQLERLNRARQAVELGLVEEACAQAEAQLSGGHPSVLLAAGQGWHPGVLGLVASRLKERYGMPALAFGYTREDAPATGSARSVKGADIGRAVTAAVAAGLALKGGGHSMAAGLTAQVSQLPALREFLAEAIGGSSPESGVLEIDGALTASGATPELVELLSRAGPFGSGNPEPVFALPAHRVAFADCAGSDHVRCSLVAGDGVRLKAIAFRSLGTELGELLLSERAHPLHVAGRLCLDDWNGRRQAQLLIEDVAEPRVGMNAS